MTTAPYYRPPFVEFRQAASVSFNLTPEQAVAFFQAKGLQPTFAWQEMLDDEHTRAFTVAKMMDVDMLKDTRALIDQAISEGRSMEWFKKEITPYLQKKGWWGKQQVVAPGGAIVKAQLGSPHRLNTIFRTNMQSAYAAGQWDKIAANAELMPYLMYDAVDDHRTRPEHAALDNLILPVEHEFWRTHYPPNGWNCRCGVIQLAQDMIPDAVPGKTGPDSGPPNQGTYKWTNPITGKTRKVPAALDPGWDYNPGMSYQKHLAETLAQKVAALPPDMQESAMAGLAAAAAEAEKAKVIAAAKAAQKGVAKAQGAAALARSIEKTKAKAALFNAQAELDAIAAKNPPYLGTALKQAEKTASWKELNATERLGLVHAKAVKIEESAALAHYKQAVAKGKKPSLKAQAAFDAQAEEIQASILADIEAKTGAAVAKKEISEILGTPGKYGMLADELAAVKTKHPEWPATEILTQAKAQAQVKASQTLADIQINPKGQTLKHKALQNLLKDPATTTKPNWEILLQVEKDAAAAQAKASQAAKLSGYKKKVLAGKIPSPSEVKAFDNLTLEEQGAFLDKIDNAVAKQAAKVEAPAAIKAAEAKVVETPATATKEQLEAIAAKEHQVAALKAKQIDLPPPDALEDSFDEVLQIMEGMQGKLDGINPADIWIEDILSSEAMFDHDPYDLLMQYNALIQTQIDEAYSTIKKAKIAYGIEQPAAVKAAKKAATQKAKAVSAKAGIPKEENLVQIGPQKGSNRGGLYQDQSTGEKFYIKIPGDEDIARNELLASKLYARAGVDAPELYLIDFNGEKAIASKFVDGLDINPAALKAGKVQGVADGFVTDAWLGNWDVAGMDYDNLLVRGNRAYRIDVGGALRYRAQGGLKGDAFGRDVTELNSLLDKATNPQASAIFKAYRKADLDAGAMRVISIPDDEIRALVKEYGPASKAENSALAQMLINRKKAIARKYKQVTAEYTAALEETIEAAKMQLKADLDSLNEKTLDAIKGIAHRHELGAALDAKDITRVQALRPQLKALIEDHRKYLDAGLVDEIQGYFDTWVVDLELAVAKGKGAPARWYGGTFDGFAPWKAKIDESRITVDISTLLNATDQMSAPARRKVLKDMGIGNWYETNQKLGDTFKRWSTEHTQAVRAYTGSSHYRKFNKSLRFGKPSPAERGYERLLNEALALATPYKGEASRGLTMHNKELSDFMAKIRQAHATGETWHDVGYMSSTKGTSAAFSGNVYLQFQSETGVYIKEISLNPHEGEVLFGTRARFMVTEIKEEKHHTTIYLQEVVE